LKNLGKKAYLLFVYSFLYIPLFVLILYSFNSAKFSLQWNDFSFRWYKELFADRGLWQAFLNSVILGFTASLITTFMGFLLSVFLFLNRQQKRYSFFILLSLLIIIPDLVFGVALLLFFNILEIPLGFLSLLIAHITFCIPFVILTINSRIYTIDTNIYYSALDLGASKKVALGKIILPLLMPAVLSAFLLSFTLSFDDVIISYFVAGPDFTILPLTIFSLVRSGVTPELNALCTITFLISMILVITAHRLGKNPSCSG
jgi:spermidine/putrescine transport system permease protein